MEECPCCSQKNYQECCGPFIENSILPNSPEELMRSRYTAFCRKNIDYIIKTMCGAAAENFDILQTKKSCNHIKWIKLNIISTKLMADGAGFVEFVAHYIIDNKQYILHELSEFHFINKRWYYVDGKHLHNNNIEKIRRNDLCPCGSGKKYKRCCTSQQT